MENIVSAILCKTFDEKVGRHQSKNPDPLALKIQFSLTLDYDREEGYRYLEILVYGPHNYVGVYCRETWTVIPVEDLEDDGHGDTQVRVGKDYQNGSTSWKLMAYHDSGWRDGMGRILREYAKRITSIETLSGGSFAYPVPVTTELLTAFEAAAKERA